MSEASSQRIGLNANLRDQVKRAREEQDETRKRDLLRQARETAKRKMDYADEDRLDREAHSESMNFSQCESLTKPIYEVKGALPKCPPGYKYSKEQKQCVPKTEKDDVRLNGSGGGKDSKPENAPSYNVWGRTGMNGDGTAWAEPNAYEGNYYDGPSIGAYN